MEILFTIQSFEICVNTNVVIMQLLKIQDNINVVSQLSSLLGHPVVLQLNNYVVNINKYLIKVCLQTWNCLQKKLVFELNQPL